MNSSIHQFLRDQERRAWDDVQRHVSGTLRQAGRIRSSDLPALGVAGAALLAGVVLGRRATRRTVKAPLESLGTTLLQLASPMLVAQVKALVESFLQRRRETTPAETAGTPTEPG
jgi:hypothetical protein